MKRLTIAMCYVTREGVVLGADSTTSFGGSGFHYYNHNQKLFELGEHSTLGIITWGLGTLAEVSHRTLFARFADTLALQPATSVADAAQRWAAFFSPIYFNSSFVQALISLHAKPAFNPNVANPAARTQDEEAAYGLLKSSLVVGFCLGGYVPADREPKAFDMTFDPFTTAQAPTEIPLGQYRFYGAPNMIARLINGFDMGVRDGILKSTKWQGTANELDDILFQQFLAHPIPPIREAVDFVHSCIYSTIKALKFSNFSQICGGPIEIGVITTDRKFRWVRHKRWDAAIAEWDRPPGESLWHPQM